jgi:hypothetical protein
LRLTRSWSAAEARWTEERHQSPEYALKKYDRAEDGKQIACRKKEVAKKGKGLNLAWHNLFCTLLFPHAGWIEERRLLLNTLSKKMCSINRTEARYDYAIS